MAETTDIKISDVTLNREYSGTLRSVMTTTPSGGGAQSIEGWNGAATVGALASFWMFDDLVYTPEDVPEDPQYTSDLTNASTPPEWHSWRIDVYIKGQVNSGTTYSELVASHDSEIGRAHV
mgnify:CR=1 FL=1